MLINVLIIKFNQHDIVIIDLQKRALDLNSLKCVNHNQYAYYMV